MRRIAAAAPANYAAITNGGGAAQYGSGRSNRCFDSKLTSEKSLALKAVAPLHVVVAAPPVRRRLYPLPRRRHHCGGGGGKLLYFGTYSSY